MSDQSQHRGFTSRYILLFRYLLPAPFTIAVLLTGLTFFIAFFFTGTSSEGTIPHVLNILGYWEKGLWNDGLMVFALQMMLMLVLGHTLALTRPVDLLIQKTVRYCTNSSKAAMIVTFSTLCVALFNWGLGLIFGAIFARKVGEYARLNQLPINYPLIGAAGYSGLMVWHGGISGSSLTKVADKGHLKEMMAGILPDAQIAQLPERVSFDETVFSEMNLTLSILLLIILPLAMYLLGKVVPTKKLDTQSIKTLLTSNADHHIGAEKLDHAPWIAFLFGGIILLYAFYKAFLLPETFTLDFINPNFINFSLFGFALIFHGSFWKFLQATEEAITGATGILIQFPLYFGIMGIMKSAGLVNMLSAFFVQISNAVTFPLFTFLSAGIVNVFVPSGGGQWAVQGPIIIKAAIELHIPFGKSILALAYGDQITNMLQPFWALPLLGITGLKAKDILPYTLFLMAIGAIIFIAGLLSF